jgi:phosphopantetheinyl transferase
MRASPPAPPALDVEIGARLSLGPRHPRLAPDELHVWVADLARVGDSIVELLNRAERARADRLARERHRAIWSRSRAVLRTLLARYVDDDAGSLNLATSRAGKPVLADEPRAGPSLHFNLSHSGPVAVYVVAADPVGIDVELVHRAQTERSPDHVALARRAFGAPIAEHLAPLAETARAREFLRLWTRHEAALKLVGRGIGGGAEHAAANTWIAELDLGAVAVAAVASERPAGVRLWSFA